MKKFSYIIMLCLPLCLKAQIHYTDIIPDTTIAADNGAYYLDFDNNGIADYKLQKIVDTTALIIEIVIYPLGDKFSVAYFNVDDCKFAERFYYDDPIPLSGNKFTIEKATLAHMGPSYCAHNGAFIGTTDAYAGMRMYRNDTVFYGWIRLDVDSSVQWFTLKDYAYCANGILAGQTYNSIDHTEQPDFMITENDEEIRVSLAEGLILDAKLFDLLSRETPARIADQSVRIRKRDYKPGLYILMIKTTSGSGSVKLVIRNS